MRKIIPALAIAIAQLMLVIGATSAANAQTIYRDSAGRIVGTSREITVPGSAPVVQFQDGQGQITGKAVGDGFGGARFYDNAGREVGSVSGDE